MKWDPFNDSLRGRPPRAPCSRSGPCCFASPSPFDSKGHLTGSGLSSAPSRQQSQYPVLARHSRAHACTPGLGECEPRRLPSSRLAATHTPSLLGPASALQLWRSQAPSLRHCPCGPRDCHVVDRAFHPLNFHVWARTRGVCSFRRLMTRTGGQSGPSAH